MCVGVVLNEFGISVCVCVCDQTEGVRELASLQYVVVVVDTVFACEGEHEWSSFICLPILQQRIISITRGTCTYAL